MGWSHLIFQNIWGVGRIILGPHLISSSFIVVDRCLKKNQPRWCTDFRLVENLCSLYISLLRYSWLRIMVSCKICRSPRFFPFAKSWLFFFASALLRWKVSGHSLGLFHANLRKAGRLSKGQSSSKPSENKPKGTSNKGCFCILSKRTFFVFAGARKTGWLFPGVYGWGWRSVIRSVAISGRFILHDKTGWGRMSGSAAAWMKSSRRIKYSMQICDNISKGLSGLCFFFVGVFEMVMFEREVFQDSVSSQCSGQSRLPAPRTTNRKSHQLGIDCSQRESSFIFQIPQKRRSFLYGLRANVLIFDSTAPNFGKKTPLL